MNKELISDLRFQITEYFTRVDLQILCLELEIRYEEFDNEAFSSTVIKIIDHCNRYGLINDLIESCEKARPDLNWPSDSRTSLPPPRNLFFVILAMTKLQAQELLDETIFDNPTVAPITKSRYTQHKNLLAKGGIENFQSLYGDTAEEWRLYKHSSSSIKQIIQQTLEYHNDSKEQTQSELLSKFVTEAFCSNMETTAYKSTKKSLEKQGGMIIVDAISLHHPYIYNKLSNSGLLTNKKIAVLILSPMNEDARMNNALVKEIIQSNMNYVFERFEQDVDPSCEIGMGDINNFKRWFMNALHHISTEKQSMPEANKRLMENKIEHKRQGMNPKRVR